MKLSSIQSIQLTLLIHSKRKCLNLLRSFFECAKYGYSGSSNFYSNRTHPKFTTNNFDIILNYINILMRLYSPTLKQVLDSWPGKKRFGLYRFLPLFFLLGAALEFSMINWTVGETNFYRTFKKRQAKQIVDEEIHLKH